MKRYRVKLFDEMHFNRMIEHPDGDWVQWEDVEIEKKFNENANEWIIDQLRQETKAYSEMITKLREEIKQFSIIKGKDMKRYSLILDKNLDGQLKARTYESDQGEWVKWKDSLRVGEIYERRIRELKAKIELKGADSEGGKMKRYRMEPYSDPSHTGVNVQANEDPNGIWVKYKDVPIKTICEVCKTNYVDVADRCNCKEMANKPDYEDHPDGLSPLPILLPPFWICPAHGYKRR